MSQEGVKFNAPTGGRRRSGLVVAAVLFLSAGLIAGSTNYVFGLLVGPLEERFGWPRTAITASLSFLAVGSVASPLLGRLMDRYGARLIMSGCLALTGLSFLLRPLMTELWQWYALSLLQFAGITGAAALPSGRLIALWYGQNTGRVMGIVTMGNNFGGIVLPLVVGAVLSAGTWSDAYLVLAFISFALALMAFAFAREPPEGSTKRGWPVLRRSLGADAGPERAPIPGLTVRQAVRTRTFYAVTAGILASSMTTVAVLPQVSGHLADIGLSSGIIPLAVSFLAAAGMIAKPTFGTIAERFTARSACMLSLTCQCVFLTMLAFATNHIMIWFALALYGLSMGAHSALMPLLVQQSFGVRNFGGIAGLVNLFTVLPFALGPIMAGASHDATGSYRLAFAITTAMYAVGAVALTQVKQMHQLDGSAPAQPRRARVLH